MKSKKFEEDVVSPSTFKSLIIKFSKEGHGLRLRKLISNNQKLVSYSLINFTDRFCKSPLHYAVRNDHFDCIDVLLNLAHADPNFVGDENSTALHYALRYRSRGSGCEANFQDLGLSRLLNEINLYKIVMAFEPYLTKLENEQQANDEVVKLLMASGAKPNAQDQRGYTPLHYAAMRGHVNGALELLKSPIIKIDAPDQRNTTPLHLSILYENTRVFLYLLAYGASPYLTTSNFETALQFACARGNPTMVLAIAAASEKAGNYERFRSLLSHKDSLGQTPFFVAAKNNQLNIASYLISQDASPSSSNINGENPIHVASVAGHLGIVEYILSISPEQIMATDNSGRTPLHKATQAGATEVVKYLLTKGSKADEIDEESRTPLHLAAEYGREEVMKVLLESVHILSFRDAQGKTVLHMAAERNHVGIVELLLQHPDSSKIVDMSDLANSTPLHAASYKGNAQIVKLLIEMGANLTLKNERERVPLHLAAKQGKIE